MNPFWRFQTESNAIEGIRSASPNEAAALEIFVVHEQLSVDDLCAYVGIIQPDARLRATSDIPGVRVGKHIAPPSGPALLADLDGLLHKVNAGAISPYAAHLAYETLHPFTDGNGRSGRALWLWMRKGDAPLGFLHQWYYDSLANSRGQS